MTFTQLDIFVLVAELKSFTATAERLNISQSAVSHAIKSLEKEWQLSLMSRHHTEFELTEAGHTLLLHAKELLSVNQTLQQHVSSLRGLHEGSIKIGSFGTSASICLLPKILEAFQQRYPKIDVYIDEGDDKEISTWLLERKIDVGFVVLPDERFDTFALTEDRFVALLPSSFPLAQQTFIHPKDLDHLPFIMTTAGSQTYVEKILQQHQSKPKIQYHFSQLMTIINMVNAQLGASIVAEMALFDEVLERYPNVIKKPLRPNVSRKIGLAVKNKTHMSPACQAFIEVAQSLFD
ncbi:LysR family transcriptional regulator [Vitreoscilla stercoraria]|uniref:LysR family transcriptional regulator n=1 Tax=Vitreoscilla stercoraria TaxID=61 RepID=A0ABY4EAQ8_VITST|nr:LysR family transcriptional regulator [Vitreoscilla stercoraria]UOO92831.1 LysR family transcriptional regulator [Vitreoscilla stercoraria]